MKRPPSTKFLQRRKFFLFLPLLVLPLIGFGYWMLVPGDASNHGQGVSGTGLNADLPGAQLKEDPLDKLAYYERSDADSLKLLDNIKHDPYRQDSIDPELKAYRQLDALDKVMTSSSHSTQRFQGTHHHASTDPETAPQVKKLEQLMHQVKEKPERDPEIEQLDSLLGKIMLIQHPENAADVLSVPENIQPVMVSTIEGPIFTVLGKTQDEISDSFEKGFEHPVDASQHLVKCKIENAQSLLPGAIVKLMLEDNIIIGNTIIPKGQSLSGISAMNGERLQVIVSSITYSGHLYPVKMVLYDIDGIAGIYVPGSLTRDVARQSAGRSLNSIGFSGIGSNLTTQLAAAGIETGKSLLTRKTRLTRIHLPAGYQVLLQNTTH